MGHVTENSLEQSRSTLSFHQDKSKAFSKSLVSSSVDLSGEESGNSDEESWSSTSQPQERNKGPLALPKSSLDPGNKDGATSHVFLLRLRDLNLGNEEGSRDAKSFYAEDSELSSGAVVRRPVFMKDEPEEEKSRVDDSHGTTPFAEENTSGSCGTHAASFETFVEDSSQRNLRDLPDDLLQLCLARVPYRYHPRLRAVCRQWYSLADGQRLLQMRREAQKTEIWTFIMENEYDYYRKYLGLRGHAYHLFKDGKRTPPPQAPYGCIMWVGDRPYVAPFEGGHPIPRLHTPLRLEFGVAGANGQVYVMGGRPPLNGWHTGFSKPDAWEVYARVDVYCPARDVWRQVSHMPLPRYGFATAGFVDPVSRKAKIIVAGGYGSDENPIGSADVYDLASDTWLEVPPMQLLDGACRGEIVGDKFYVKQVHSGGLLEAFDFVSMTWSTVPDNGQVDLDPLHLGDTNNNRSRSFTSLEL